MAINQGQTVAFIEATDYLKEERKIDFNEIADQLGLTYSQMNMIRIKRRRVKDREIEKLVKLYPYVKHFFETPQTLNEPDAPNYQVGDISIKLISALEELLEKEREIAALKNQIGKLETENKRLKNGAAEHAK